MTVHISAWVFPTSTDAAAALNRLTNDAAQLEVADAVAVSWTRNDRRPRWTQLDAHPNRNPTRLPGEFWDLIMGLIFYIPLLHAATGRLTGDPLLESRDLNVDRQLLHILHDEVTPGRSALFSLGSPEWVDAAEDAMHRYGKRQLFTTALDSSQQDIVAAALATNHDSE